MNPSMRMFKTPNGTLIEQIVPQMCPMGTLILSQVCPMGILAEVDRIYQSVPHRHA